MDTANVATVHYDIEYEYAVIILYVGTVRMDPMNVDSLMWTHFV
jgi:hypothetical protein